MQKIIKRANSSGLRKAEQIVSKIPVDKHDCLCSKLTENKLYTTCPRSSEYGMRKYQILCDNCGDSVAFIYATDESLTDWCDLHYTCFNDGKYWHGCMSVNISPIDQSLGFECSCGQDTRDFRANNTLPNNVLIKIIERNSKGREFNKKDSKFKVIKL